MTHHLSKNDFKQPKNMKTDLGTSIPKNMGDARAQIDRAVKEEASELKKEITILRQENSQLKKSSALLQKIVQNAPINIAVRDLEGHYLLVNSQYENNIGIATQDALGKTPYDLFDIEKAEKIVRYDHHILEKGKNMQNETTYLIDNKEHEFLSIRTPITDKDHKPFAVCEMGVDITEYKNAENALRESQTRYSRIIESITDFIFTVDVQNGCLLEPVKSPACFAITGYEPEAFNADLDIWSRLIHEDDQPMVRKHMDHIFQDHEISSIEHRIVRKDGQIRWVKNTIIPHPNEYGVLRSYEILIQEITAHKQAEQEKKKLQSELQQAQKMEAIGTLAGGIAHDFNNILSIIVGNVELAMLNIPDDSKARQNLEKTFTAAMRARDLINQILAFSRQSEKRLMPCDIRPIVKESIRLLRAFIPSSIEIRQNIPSKVDSIMTDPTQISQILINLSSNAAHSMRQNGGILEIRMENVEVDEEIILRSHTLSPGKYLKLTVSDTGTGMTPDIMERIFDPYFTTKKAGEGTGMGLSVVHGIMKKHGGGISVSSSEDRGSIFDMYFPCIEKKSIKMQQRSFIKILKGNEHILFVDDEEAVVQTAREMLEQFGYHVTVKTDSVDAFRTFKDDPGYFDLLLTDQTMPKLTGVNLAEEVMKIRSDMPIILSTGYSDLVNEEEINALGIRGYIMKPYAISELTRKIRSVLDSN
ncbi:MAG: PAS domain S-box protein [Deltaproteobacteria bacterium]|nr:PAS domain S-box protein [Deltaproteobacteria bacterium]